MGTTPQYSEGPLDTKISRLLSPFRANGERVTDDPYNRSVIGMSLLIYAFLVYLLILVQIYNGSLIVTEVKFRTTRRSCNALYNKFLESKNSLRRF